MFLLFQLKIHKRIPDRRQERLGAFLSILSQCLDMNASYRRYVSLTCIAFPRPGIDADADDLRIVHRARPTPALFLRTETLIDLFIPHLPSALRLQSAHDS